MGLRGIASRPWANSVLLLGRGQSVLATRAKGTLQKIDRPGPDFNRNPELSRLQTQIVTTVLDLIMSAPMIVTNWEQEKLLVACFYFGVTSDFITGGGFKVQKRSYYKVQGRPLYKVRKGPLTMVHWSEFWRFFFYKGPAIRNIGPWKFSERKKCSSIFDEFYLNLLQGSLYIVQCVKIAIFL